MDIPTHELSPREPFYLNAVQAYQQSSATHLISLSTCYILDNHGAMIHILAANALSIADQFDNPIASTIFLIITFCILSAKLIAAVIILNDIKLNQHIYYAQRDMEIAKLDSNHTMAKNRREQQRYAIEGKYLKKTHSYTEVEFIIADIIFTLALLFRKETSTPISYATTSSIGMVLVVCRRVLKCTCAQRRGKTEEEIDGDGSGDATTTEELTGNTESQKHRTLPHQVTASSELRDIERKLAERKLELGGVEVELIRKRKKLAAHKDQLQVLGEEIILKKKELDLFSGGGEVNRMECDRLKFCGHRCLAMCQSDEEHRTSLCLHPCERLHSQCQHSCPKVCGDDCGFCLVNIEDLVLPCSHCVNVKCYQSLEPSTIRCKEPTEKILPGCGHTITVPCHIDTTSSELLCKTRCEETLECGHRCFGTCGGCLIDPRTKKKQHPDCLKICGRKFTICGHTCPRKCHDGEACGPCGRPCEVRCAHSACDRKCSEPCIPCVEACIWECEHQGRCDLPCAAPCNRLPCDQRCTRILKCGHQCPSLCGETCPSHEFCQLCATKDKQELCVGIVLLQTYAETDVNTDPIIVLRCGHFFTTDNLDGILDMKAYYDQDENGSFSAAKLSDSPMQDTLPFCPDCRTTISQFSVRRYSRILNKAVMEVMTRNYVLHTEAELAKLENRLQTEEATLIRTAKSYSQTIYPQKHGVSLNLREIGKRSKEFFNLTRKIHSFVAEVQSNEQPARKLRDATYSSLTRLANSENTSHSAKEFLEQPRNYRLDRGMEVKALLLGLASHCVSLVDTLSCTKEIIGVAGVLELAQDIAKKLASNIETIENECAHAIFAAQEIKLHGVSVRAALHFGRLILAYRSFTFSLRSGATAEIDALVEKSMKYLEEAKKLCSLSFKDSDKLLVAVETTIAQLGTGGITKEEFDSLLLAMKSDLRNNTGHWYTCENGHPFAVGECGLPMQLARCPECGAAVGGTDHQPASGVQMAAHIRDQA